MINTNINLFDKYHKKSKHFCTKEQEMFFNVINSYQSSNDKIVSCTFCFTESDNKSELSTDELFELEFGTDNGNKKS